MREQIVSVNNTTESPLQLECHSVPNSLLMKPHSTPPDPDLYLDPTKLHTRIAISPLNAPEVHQEP